MYFNFNTTPSYFNRIFVFFNLCLLFLAPSCSGGNILVYPIDGSHWINMRILLEELHARGHNITVIRVSTSWYIKEKSPIYSSITVEVEEALEDFFDVFIKEQIRREGASLSSFFRLHKDFISMISHAHALRCNATKHIFENKNLVKQIIDSKFDLVLTDPAMSAGVVLAKYFNLPVVLNVRWITSGEGHFVLAPSPLSYIPVPGSGLTDRMDFLQRLKNIFFYGIINFQQIVMVGPIYDDICSKYIEGGCSIVSLLQQADIWLFRSDFVFDFPRPTMPNVVYIGGFQCKPADPLPADLEKFVQSSGEHGVIIMTLGTLVNELPQDVANEIAVVFSKMPQKVIWRHIGDRPSKLGDNTLIVDWMPQKDLLGHPQVKVFVAHGGTNGVQEAIYHGVPVLGIPLFFDQYDNLLRLQERGAGKILQLADLNGRTFEEGLKEVLYNISYRQNIQRLSRLHKDKPMSPMDQAIFWIEYVIRHKGARHLISEAFKMPWYSYHSLDVVLLVLAVETVLLYFIYAVFRFLCCRRKRKTKTKQN
uniref:UDP-glucuronosyltransferase n=1 Tax=Oryzias latipes TaxID=8090 RepID=A0A3P9KV00_ORYLA